MFYKNYDPKGKGDDESDEYEESDYSINSINYYENSNENENKNNTRVENNLNMVKEIFKVDTEKVGKYEWCRRTYN